MTSFRTNKGNMSSGELMARLMDTVPAAGRVGWVPGTDVPWLEELRERHEAAARACVAPLAGLVQVFAAYEAACKRVEAEMVGYARERSAALRNGRMVPE